MQENDSAPPFHIGQKVVCIESAGNIFGKVTRGKEYIIEGILICPQCKTWKVDVGLRANVISYNNCKVCGKKILDNTDMVLAQAKYFAPIETRKVEIAEEILNSIQITEEVPDRILVPETAN